MSAAELLSWSLAELAARIRGGEVSSREATTAVLEALDGPGRGLERRGAARARGGAGGGRPGRRGAGERWRRWVRCTACRWRTRTCSTVRAGLAECGSALMRGAPADGHGLGDRAAGRRRCGRCRAAQHGRVRAGHHRPQPAHRPSPQPLGPRADHRRLDQRRRCRRRGPADPGDAGLRHRRLDPRAGGHLRRVRAEADLWPGQPRRLHAAVVLARPCRPAGALARGSGADAAGDRRA